ncbi:hypothetical protein L210DRAFT_3507638 [Boletus edulis BED1]|uniref:Uncharacterized protein n=1 Tax=Boletus edulis BED1 TaxID=1328754 RepID=A0AAD4BJT4_BOLED|nr:hypothetical protein L210DRAFT_3507638 [Boletus edulis BED1]
MQPPRKHIHIAFKIIGTPIICFSCQWEFINDIMGAAVGKFYNNQTLNEIDVTYIKQGKMLCDWGYAEDCHLDTKVNTSRGQMTGTFPFTFMSFLMSHWLDSLQVRSLWKLAKYLGEGVEFNNSGGLAYISSGPTSPIKLHPRTFHQSLQSSNVCKRSGGVTGWPTTNHLQVKDTP